MTSSSKRFGASNTRNICIVGHVDHGKSSYADSLLAANNIISARSAGKLRYLDSRQDEQERGITMESSAVSLSYRTMKKSSEGAEPVQEDYMVNLIDTPGHVDFSSEVSTASRLCDGALVMVDAVEGVCTQTITVLRQAWMERLKPILVVNKLDRLITELRLAPIEAHHHLTQLIEQVNAVMGSFHAGERMEDDLKWKEERERRLAAKKEKLQEQAAGQANDAAEASTSTSNDEAGAQDDEETYEERDDEDIYFAPEQGNVIFASAVDGWAFRVGQFAQIHAKRLGIKETNLRKVLWGDFYLDPKTKRVLNRKHLGKRSLKPMFVQFVLENLWAVYDSVILNHDADRITKIIAALGIKVRPQELKSKDYRILLTTVLSQWLPLAPATFRAVVEIIPPPQQAQSIRIPKMLHPDLPYHQLTVKAETKLEEDLYSGNASPDAFVVAYVSKMFAVPASALPQNQRKPLTAEEMRQRGRASREAAAALAATGATLVDEEKVIDLAGNGSNGAPAPAAEDKVAEEIDEDEESLLGFSRLYSGVMKAGQTLYAVLPKYNTKLPPSHPRNKRFITPVRIDNLYMMMGKELVMVDQVPAGNVFAVGGLEGKILRNGTLCGYGGREIDLEATGAADKDKEALVNLAGLNMTSAPIVRVALEPKDPSEMPKLVEGLRLLNQADSCVETLVQETGEHVILTAGELHLERCIRDLKERFAKIEIQASPPIVPFRETAIQAVDMVPPKTKDAPRGTIHGNVQGNLVEFTVRARPLPAEITAFLTAHIETLKRVVQRERELSNKAEPATYEDSTQDTGAEGQGEQAAALANLNPDDFWKHLEALFAKAGREWQGVASRIWAFGPRRIGPNILVDAHSTDRSLQTRSQLSKTSLQGTPARASSPQPDATPDLQELPTELPTDSKVGSSINIRAFDESIETAFQLTTLRGPLCHEPVVGMAYFFERLNVNQAAEGADALQTRFSQVTGSLITSANEAFRQGLLDWSPRLLLAMYSCDIQASTDVLGKVYGVVARRRGRIVAEEMKEGTSFFTVSALLPVVEGFGFADEIRKRTSGAASPQLVFHGYEMLDQDPYWVPTTEEELEDLGEKADRENVARRYMDGVRRRKGLFVEKKVIEHAEKQRTLKK